MAFCGKFGGLTILITGLCFVSSCQVGKLAQPQVQVAAIGPKDPGGWDKIRWGMTLDQARAIYPEQAKSPENIIEAFSFGHLLNELMLQGVQVGDDMVANVQLWSVPSTKLVRRIYVGLKLPAEGARDELLVALTQKYGAPTFRESRKVTCRQQTEDSWIFPSTSIKLWFSEIREGKSIRSAQLAIIYTQADTKLATTL